MSDNVGSKYYNDKLRRARLVRQGKASYFMSYKKIDEVLKCLS